MKWLGIVLSAQLLLGLSSPSEAVVAASMWRDVDPQEAAAGLSAPLPVPGAHPVRVLELNADRLGQRLAAPRSAPASRQVPDLTSIELPLPEGGYRQFRLTPSGVLPPELAEKYPGIQSYAGVATDDPTVRVRLDWSASGLHAMVIGGDDVDLIEPVRASRSRLYTSYRRKDVARRPWREGTRHREGVSEPVAGAAVMSASGVDPEAGGFEIGTRRHTYRIAVSADSSYTQYHGGTVDSALAAIVKAINRVNGIYEKELSVHFVLVPGNDQLIFPDSGTDPFAGLDDDAMLYKNQRVIDQLIGSRGYDIGHLFNARSGGLAEWASVCRTPLKAQGLTGSDDPEGDPFWVDYVAHEIGHQMGGNHTFNSPLGSCSGNRERDSAYELGSGVSIMGYAGICGQDNLQKNSIPYFHARSLYEIGSNLTSGDGSRCGLTEATDLLPPVIQVADRVYTIPKRTPFELMATGVGTESSGLSYSWEEYDLAEKATTVASTRRQKPMLGEVPLFRSFEPLAVAQRLIPERDAALSPKPWTQREEILPGYGRSLRFKLTVRDGQGGVSTSPIQTVDVANNAGPFVVQFPGKNSRWISGSTRRVRWSVARTDLPPVACSSVDIDLSTDGGEHFKDRLASQVGNNGDQAVVVPATLTGQARVRVKCADNIFLSISPGFSIVP